MDVFRRIVLSALIAGVLSGGLIAVAHHFGTAALIAKAEVYEKAAEAAETTGSATNGLALAPAPHVHDAVDAPHAHDHAAAGMGHHDEVAWEPEDGPQRTAFTALADIMTAIAFALVLVGVYELRGGAIDWRRGLCWGLAGFAAFTLAPALGLPPEVPGTEAAPLLARQVWWAGTAAATAAGLGLIFLQASPLGAAVGVLCLFAPHAVGAPMPAVFQSAAPELLARQFVTVSVMSSLLLWLSLGVSTAMAYRRFRNPVRLPAPLGYAV